MSSIFEASPHDHTMRRLTSAVSTLAIVAEYLDDVEDIDDTDERADLLIAVENLIDVAFFITERGREIAWQYTPVPESEE